MDDKRFALRHIEGLIASVDGTSIAVMQAKQLPAERKIRQQLITNLALRSQISTFVIVENLDAANADRVAMDVERGAPGGPEDIVREVAAAGLAMNLLGVGGAKPIRQLLHTPSGLSANLISHGGLLDAEVLLLRGQQPVPELLSFEQNHPYLQASQIAIQIPDGIKLNASLIPLSRAVTAEAGKSFALVVKAESLYETKAKGKKGSVRDPQPPALSDGAGKQLMALIKHIGASLHVSQANIQAYVMFPAADADFVAAQWVNRTGESARLSTQLSPAGLLTLAEFAAYPGSVVQGYARVLPGVPTRVGQFDASGYRVVEILALTQGVQQRVSAFPISFGKLYY
jgi:hypothetical protein